MIQWKDDYLLGIKIIDDQHKEIFRIANDAYDLLNNPFFDDKYDKIVAIINELRDYASFHFETEEKYMDEIGYNKILSHKVVHSDFVERFKKVDLEKIDENQDEYIMSIIDFVLEWITKHILQTDTLYVQFKNKKR